MMGFFCLVDPRKYIGIDVHCLYDGIKDTTRIFSRYILMDILTDAHHSHRTKDKHYDHLFAQFFLGISHHVFQHINRFRLNYH